MDVGLAVGSPPASRMAIEQRRVNANRELGKLPGGRLMERVLGEDIRRSQWADLPCTTLAGSPTWAGTVWGLEERKKLAENVCLSSDTNVLDLEAEAQHLTYGQDCDAPGATVGVAFHLPDSS